MDLASIFKGVLTPSLVLAAEPPAYTIVSINDAYTHLINCSDTEVIGKDILDIFPKCFHAADRARLAASLNQVLSTKKIQQFRLDFTEEPPAGGNTAGTGYLELINAPVINQKGDVTFILQTVLQVSRQHTSPETKRQAPAAQVQQQQPTWLFENYPDGLYAMDLSGKLIHVNARLLQLLGCSREELDHCHWQHFFELTAQQQLAASRQKAQQGDTHDFETRLFPTLGPPLTVHITHLPIFNQNQLTGIYGIVQDITRQVQTTRELEEREHQLNTIYNTVGDAIFVLDITPDDQFKFSSVNNSFLEVTGIPYDQVVGQYVQDVISEPARSMVLKKYQEAIREHKKINWEETSHYPAGQLTGEVQVTPVFNEQGRAIRLVGAVHDLTNWKAAEAALATSEQIYKALFEQNPDAVYSLDLQGNFMSANEKAAILTEMPVTELFHTAFTALIAPQDLERVNKHFRKALAGEYQYYETGIITAKGNHLTINVTNLPIIVNGKIIGVYGISRDITGIREAEARQQKLMEDLYKQNQDLQQFTYIVSHNLRPPVANILGLVDLLINGDKADELNPLALTYMKTSLKQLDLVLHELNMVLSLRDNKSVVQREQVDLLLLCQQVVQKLNRLLAECGGSIIWHIPPGTVVWANKAYLYNILDNLLANAIKYRSPDRKLRITLASAGNTRRGVILTVADNGIGMDIKRVGKKIFKLYNRFHASYEGRGIGLFLVKSHVEAMGGRIEVSSQEHLGTSFKIHLPAPKKT